MNSVAGLSVGEIDAIVARASRLHERFSGDFVPAERSEMNEGAAAPPRLERLKQLVSAGDPDRFQQYLLAHGVAHLPEAELLKLLGPVQRRKGLAQPEWTDLLSEMVASIRLAFADQSVSSKRGYSPAHRSIPYIELYQPIAVLAKRRIRQRQPSANSLLRDRAWRGLEGYLLNRISSICSVAIHSRFLAHKAARQINPIYFFALPPERPAKKSSAIYQTFIQQIGSEGLVKFFEQYPVAARLVAEVTSFWIEFACEFLSRLAADQVALAKEFNGGQPVGHAAQVQAGVSDPHLEGRGVLIITFGSGVKLTYKPRSLQPEADFSTLLNWANAQGFYPSLHALQILERPTYGWMGFAQHEPCKNQAAAKRWHERAGALACLAHALDGIDFHHENLIAAGEHPVLVDLEAMCHPRLGAGEALAVDASGDAISIGDSVLRTGLFPLWRKPLGGRGPEYNLSALGGPTRTLSLFPKTRWKNFGTDALEMFESRAVTTAAHTNLPLLLGRGLAAKNYIADIQRGFRRMLTLLKIIERREEVSGGTKRLARCRGRLILRPTAVYLMLLRHSLHPQFLANGIDRGIELSALPRLWNNCPIKVYADEVAALENLDIPWFSSLDAEWKKCRSKHLRSLSDLELKIQLEIIKRALRSKLYVAPKA